MSDSNIHLPILSSSEPYIVNKSLKSRTASPIQAAEYNLFIEKEKLQCFTYPNQQYKELEPGSIYPFQKKKKKVWELQLNTSNRDSQHLHLLPWERSTDEHETKTITDGQIKPLLITQMPSNMASSPQPVFLLLL